MNKYKEIIKEIKKNNKILILTHIRADGDCVGSSIGLREIIKSTFKDKEVKALYENVHYLSYLGKSDKVTDEDFNDSLIISVDNASLKRCVDERGKNLKRVIKIDHHPNIEPFGYINVVEEEKCACAEMIIDFYKSLKGAKISKLGVEALYTGLVTDSGRFKFPGVTGDTLRKVGMLYDLGLDANKILNTLDETTLKEIRFKGYVLENLEMTENGVVFIKIKGEDRERFEIEFDDASNMVNSLGNIKGSPIWVLFNEYNSDEIRCRVRSIDIPINDTAVKFGGGGHANASGIVVKSWEVVDNILKDLDEKLKNFKND